MSYRCLPILRLSLLSIRRYRFTVLAFAIAFVNCVATAKPPVVGLGSLPLSFEPNVGQFDEGVSFYVRGAGVAIAVAPTETTMILSERPAQPRTQFKLDRDAGTHRRTVTPAPPSRQIKLELVGANRQARGGGEGQLPGIINYILGNEPSAWKTGITTFERARFERVYPGVDLVYYGNQSQLEYDFVVSPGANPESIRLRFTGMDEVKVDDAGELVLRVGDRELRWRKPVAYQTTASGRAEVAVSYRLSPSRQVEFSVGRYDPSRELVIDPLLVYATYLGGADLDSIQSMTVDNWGNIYFAGTTYSTNFPVLRAYRTNPYAYADAFVTKLNSNATALVFSTYFGGGSNDWANAIAVDSGSNVFIAGFTDSLNLPTRNEFSGSAGAFGDAFLTRFGPFGSNLVYSTYFGDGNGNFKDYEEAFALAVNNSGNAWIAGATASGSAFPSKAPIQNGFGGGFQDAMVARFDTSASGNNSLVWASWLGGNYSDVAYGVAVDSSDNCYVVGTMLAEFDDFGQILPASFPVLNAYQPNYGGGFNDAFLVKISGAGNPSRVYATFLGGSSEDSAYGVTVDAAGQPHVCGETASYDFPIVNGHQTAQADGGFFSDAFVTKFNSAGSAMLYSSYFGGTRSDGARSVLVDRFGHIYLAGYTQSGDLLVTPDAVMLNLGGIVGDDSDLFAAKLNPAIPGFSSLIYATYYGGSDREAFGGDFDYWSLFAPANLGVGLGLDTNLNFYLASDTFSTNLPMAGGAVYKPNAIGGGDVFAAKIASPVDVSVSISASASEVLVGSNVTYSVFVNNNGLSTFTNAIATVVLPAKLQFLGATNSPGVVSNSGNTIYFAYGNLTNSAARQSTILARPLAPDKGLTNMVTLTATPLDANTNNNRAQLTTSVRGIANLALGVTVNPNPVLASSNLTFTLSVTNLGPWPASDVLLTNPIPSGLTYAGAVSSQGAVPTVVGGLFYAFLFGLNTNAVATVTITYIADSNPGGVVNKAGVYHRLNDELDPALGNNSATTAATINPLTDVVIGLATNSFAGPNLIAGSNFTYRVFVTNNGPSSASSVFVTNLIPSGVTYVSSSPSRGSVTLAPNGVLWNVTSLASGQSADLSILLRPDQIGLITNTSVIASAAADPIQANNTSSASSLVSPSADLNLSMVAPGQPVVVTSNVVYSITVSNRGPTFATNVVVANPVPAQSQFVAAQASQGSTTFDGSTVRVNLGQLNPNATATISLTLQCLIEGSLLNSATVSAGVMDPVAGNNSASAVATVTNHPAGPILRITRVGSTTNAVLYWTTNSAGFFLESTTNLFSPASWVSNTTLPVIKGTQYHVTNGITPIPRHYRLRQNPILSPLLSVRRSGSNILLFWSTTSPGFLLQSSTGLAPPAWTYVSNSPAITAGQYLVSLPNTSSWRFFRLIR